MSDQFLFFWRNSWKVFIATRSGAHEGRSCVSVLIATMCSAWDSESKGPSCWCSGFVKGVWWSELEAVMFKVSV